PAFIVLPFAGYYLGREIYAFNQTMGITMMGGFMSWLWIIQAILIGVLFLGSNYYLWLGMERIPGSERYRKFVPPMLVVLTIGFMVWATPRSMVVTLDEARAMGGTHHPLLGFFGVMSAKNTVVNLMILTTFLSFILYRRANKLPTRSWVKAGMAIQWAAFAAAAAVVVFYGIYGYFVESIVRIGFSVYQVLAVLGAIVLVMAIDIPMFNCARTTGQIRWGTIAPHTQYVPILLAMTFTWLMGLMGFAPTVLRQHLHVYCVIRVSSVDAATPAQLIRAGEEIFKTKGTCEICHRMGQKGTRAPDLGGIGAGAGKTKPGLRAKAYIIESLLQPSAYIVEGYPPIMPAVDKPPIALNRSEVWALTAFLESLGGTVDVTLNDIPASVGAGGGAAAAAEFKIPGDPKGGEAVFQGKGTCIACHKAGKIGASPVGPDLSQIAKIQT